MADDAAIVIIDSIEPSDLIASQPHRFLVIFWQRNLTMSANRPHEEILLHVPGWPTLPLAEKYRFAEAADDVTDQPGFLTKLTESGLTGAFSRVHLAARDAPYAWQKSLGPASPHDQHPIVIHRYRRGEIERDHGRTVARAASKCSGNMPTQCPGGGVPSGHRHGEDAPMDSAPLALQSSPIRKLS